MTVPLCPVDGAPVDQGQEERREDAVRGGAAAPERDTVAEVQEHEISGHERYRSWCRACVAGRGRADTHVERPGLRKVFRSLELTTATCGAEHQKRQMRHTTWSQARIRQMESEPRRQCSVEGAVWIGGSLVIFVRQR